FVLWRRWSFYWELRPRVSAGRGRGPESRLRWDSSPTDLHGLPVDVRDHHPSTDYRRDRRTHEIQRHGPIPDAVVSGGLRAAGAHGVGQGRAAERITRRKNPDAGFCGRYGCAHFFGRFGAGLRSVSWETHRISKAADAAA